jgi:hypothetical protein
MGLFLVSWVPYRNLSGCSSPDVPCFRTVILEFSKTSGVKALTAFSPLRSPFPRVPS